MHILQQETKINKLIYYTNKQLISKIVHRSAA